jgi:hypothetical protein
MFSAVAGTVINWAEANATHIIKYVIQIHISSPIAKTYNTNMIQLNISASFAEGRYKPWKVMYSVDGGPFEVVFSGQSKTPVIPDDIKGNTVKPRVLLNLPDGVHEIVARAVAGNTVVCTSVTFNINTVPPYLSLVLPENKTYTVADIPLNFFAAGLPKMYYVLDDQSNVPVVENTTLSGVPDGTHHLTLYGTSESGTMFSTETVFFAVNAVFPKITILSIENKTYFTRDLPLIFNVREPPSEISYRLDWGSPVHISGNTTLTMLSYGSHVIIVQSWDSLGPGDYEGPVFFSIEPQKIGPFPVALVVFVAVIVAVVGVGSGLLIYRIKRK